MTPVLSAPETGLPEVGGFQATRIHLPLRYLTVQSRCWCFQTFWALHGQQHGLLRGSPKSLTTHLPKKAAHGPVLVFPKKDGDGQSWCDIQFLLYDLIHLSLTIKEEKDACHRNHSSEYFSLSLNLDSMKRADLPFRSTSRRYARGPSQWCHIASGHPRTIDASCPTPTGPGGRNRRARAGSGGEASSVQKEAPWPWFSAYLVGKDGTWPQPLHFATAHPIPHTPGGLKVAFLEACPAISSEVKQVVLVCSLFPAAPSPGPGLLMWRSQSHSTEAI